MLQNPLSLVYDGLWTCLEASPAFLALFPHGTVHQVRYTTRKIYDPDPDLESFLPADLPVCRITFRHDNPSLHANSDQTVLSPAYDLEICTGQQMQQSVMDTMFSVILGCSKWQTYLQAAVTGGGTFKITSIQLEDIEATDGNAARNRGTNQWIGMCRVRVSLTYATSTLIAN